MYGNILQSINDEFYKNNYNLIYINMKKLFLFVALILSFSFISCGKPSPEAKAKEIIEKAKEAIKTLDFAQLQKIQDEETKYLEDCTEDEKEEYRTAQEKYSKELLGEMFGVDNDLDESIETHKPNADDLKADADSSKTE